MKLLCPNKYQKKLRILLEKSKQIYTWTIEGEVSYSHGDFIPRVSGTIGKRWSWMLSRTVDRIVQGTFIKDLLTLNS